MRPLLVLILVLAAAGGFFFVLMKGESGESGDPGTVLGPSTSEAVTPAAAPGPAQLEQVAQSQSKREAAPETVQPTQVAPQSARLETGRGTVRGAVVDEGGTPISGAEVRLTRYGSDSFFFIDHSSERVPDITTKTDKEGRYELLNAPVFDSYSLVVTHSKFSRSERSQVAVREGKITDEPNIVLGPGVGLSGRVTDRGGNNVPGALVRVSFTPLASLLGNEADSIETKSDGEGLYAFSNLAAGNYSMTVMADGYGRIDVQSINVDGKEAVTKDIVLDVAHMIAGSVRTIEGAPLADVEVKAYSMDSRTNQSWSQVRSDEKGEFIVQDVPEGRYLIQAQLAGYEMAINNLRVETGDMAVQVQMRALPRVRGQVLSAATGQPISSFVAQLRQPVPGAETSTTAVPSSRVTVTASPDGRFELGAPAAGEYRVHVKAEGHADTLSARFVVSPGSDVNNIVVRAIQGGKLRGRVLDGAGKPVAGARVSSHHRDWSDDLFTASLGELSPWLATEASTVTDAEGRFALSNLMPESYQLLVKHPEYASAVQTDLLVSDGGETIARDIVLPTGSTVAGIVYGPNGRPLPGAVVHLQAENAFAGSPPGGPYSGRADDNGRYVIHNVKQGSYGAWASRPRSPATNPFQESIDLKLTKRTLTVTEGGRYESEDFKLRDQ